MKNNQSIAFSTEFNNHKGLIHKLTKKCWARLKDAGIDDHEYEDIFQINCISYVKVAKAYDPLRGITFGAYLGRAIYNEFNKFAEKSINEKHELGLISYDDFSSEDNDFSRDNGTSNILDFYISSIEIGEEKMSREIARENINKLSSIGKLVIRELLAPSPGLQQAFLGIKAHSELAKAQGEKYIRVPTSINIRTIKVHYGLHHRDIVNLRNEFKEFLGVEIE